MFTYILMGPVALREGIKGNAEWISRPEMSFPYTTPPWDGADWGVAGLTFSMGNLKLMLLPW